MIFGGYRLPNFSNCELLLSRLGWFVFAGSDTRCEQQAKDGRSASRKASGGTRGKAGRSGSASGPSQENTPTRSTWICGLANNKMNKTDRDNERSRLRGDAVEKEYSRIPTQWTDEIWPSRSAINQFDLLHLVVTYTYFVFATEPN